MPTALPLRRVPAALLVLGTVAALVAVAVPASQAQGVPVCRPAARWSPAGARQRHQPADPRLQHPGHRDDLGGVRRDGHYLYASSTDTLSVLIRDGGRGADELAARGVLPIVNFENESMTYGERRDTAGEITDRFVIVAEDTVSAHQDGAHTGGHNVVIIDVTDPTNAHVRATGEIPTSTHTVQCVSRLQCEYAYAVGEDGVFKIIDLTDLDDPKPVEGKETLASPAAGPNAVFTSGAGHDWWFDEAGVGWHTGSGGIAAFDVSDPLAPRLLNQGDESSISPPLNDFILHNAKRPFAAAYDDDRAANEPNLAKGNVALVTEEDYLNDGDEVSCSESGLFETWYVPNLDGVGRAGRRGRRRAGHGFDPRPRRDQPAARAGPARGRVLLRPLVRLPRDRDRRRGLLPGWAAPDRRA